MSTNQGKRRKGTKEMIENRNVNIITDADGKKLVLINDIRFKGKRQIDWDDVKQYLEGYVGDYYEIEENAERIYIGSELPEEYTESESRKSLMGANAKVKANAATAIPELIQIASIRLLKKTARKSTIKMPDTAATGMMSVLPSQSMRIMCLSDTIYSMPVF